MRTVAGIVGVVCVVVGGAMLATGTIGPTAVGLLVTGAVAILFDELLAQYVPGRVHRQLQDKEKAAQPGDPASGGVAEVQSSHTNPWVEPEPAKLVVGVEVVGIG